MKKVLLVLVFLASPTMVFASPMNIDPYFVVGASALQAESGGQSSTAPSSHLGIGAKLNWISSSLRAEFRFGLGGQHAVFNGEVDLFASYLLKPGFEITDNFDVYGVLGVTTMTARIGTVSSTGSSLSYGAGVRYYIPNESLFIEGEWIRYREASNSSATSISGLSVQGGAITIGFDYY